MCTAPRRYQRQTRCGRESSVKSTKSCCLHKCLYSSYQQIFGGCAPFVRHMLPRGIKTFCEDNMTSLVSTQSTLFFMSQTKGYSPEAKQLEEPVIQTKQAELSTKIVSMKNKIDNIVNAQKTNRTSVNNFDAKQATSFLLFLLFYCILFIFEAQKGETRNTYTVILLSK